MSDRSPAIANEFIRKAGLHARHLTHMQLQKLVYLAHGWNLAINGDALTDDIPYAWDYGPVYRDIYDALRRYGSGPVMQEISENDFGGGKFFGTDEENRPVRAQLSAQERAVIDRVFSDYGQFHAYQLSALTHQDGTPWDQVYNHGAGRMAPIDNLRVKRHFIDLAHRPRQPA